MAARRKPAAKRRDASVPLGIWILLGLLILLLAAVLIVLLMRMPAAPVSEETAPTARDVREVRKEPEQTAVPPPPRFEFYRLLPEQSVERSTGSTTPPTPAVPAPEPAPSVDLARFEIQVGSFRNKADAERRKAEVALLGH
ncbi:MAG TPA: SPOR domain-containing protein, partial [Halothiobacillus sp.]|nr:SPOR domain-containing protein [Halothiobacillus sp.]